MALVADTIEEARLAYGALERRAESAERLAAVLQSALDQVRASMPATLIPDGNTRQLIADLMQANQQLQENLRSALVPKADLALQRVIESFAFAAALGEATMPDRIVASLTATLQSYITLAESGIGLQFFQPGLGVTPASLSSTTLELSRVPPASAAGPSPRLYAVWEQKQEIYSNPFWSPFKSGGASATSIAADLVILVARVLRNTDQWSFSYLVSAAVAVAARERELAGLVAARAPGSAAAAYTSAADQLVALTAALSPKLAPVAGDLGLLTASLDRVTGAARALLP